MYNKFLISVIVPFYKRIDLLKATLNSILYASQKEFDLEVILVDDCSPDVLLQSDFEHYRRLGLNLFIYMNKSNLGPGPSRMNGLLMANGKYVHFMDSDDLIHPDFYKKLSALLEMDSGLSMVYGYSRYFDGQTIHNIYKRQQSINYNLLDCLVENGRVWSTSACLWRTEMAKASSVWKSGISRVWEDYYFDIAVGLQNPRINGVAENLVLYRIHQGDQLSSFDSIEVYWDRLSATYKIFEMLVKFNSATKYKIWIKSIRNRYLLWALNATTKDTLWYSFNYLLKLDAKFLPLLFLSRKNRWRFLKRI